MNTNLKKALLLVSASAGVLSLSAVTADVASAGDGTGYTSGSTSVTNMDGSTYSAGGEFGGAGQAFNSLVVTPTFNAIGTAAPGMFNVNNLTVNGTVATTAAATSTISQQVITVLNGLSGTAGSTVGVNLSPYVSIIRAAGGANGLE